MSGLQCVAVVSGVVNAFIERPGSLKGQIRARFSRLRLLQDCSNYLAQQRRFGLNSACIFLTLLMKVC